MELNEQQPEVQTEVNEPEKKIEVVSIYFRDPHKSYYFDPAGYKVSKGQQVIVDTARGMEMAIVKNPSLFVSEKDIVSPLRPLVRIAQQDDLLRKKKNDEIEKNAREIFPSKAKQFGLEMKLIRVECTFDNTRLTFIYTAEEKVDFRELVKSLASQFHTRIEMRQIGVRDEAKIIGGLGPCGKPFCCATFLNECPQVSIKMAKEQNLLLNNQKNSGVCGRLMCCLRYENDVYEEANKFMPRIGSYVMTPDGKGTIYETKPLQALIRVRLEESGSINTYTLDQINAPAKAQKDSEIQA